MFVFQLIKTIMKLQFLLFVFLLFTINTKAQVSKTVYAQLGGPGIISANYDMRFTHKEAGIGGRIGIGGLVINDDFSGKTSLLTLPIGVNYLLGKDGKNYFEVGAGFTYVSVNTKAQFESSTLETSFGNLTLGYRLAPAAGGFMFKAEITPIFNKNGFIPYYGGIGFGYKF